METFRTIVETHQERVRNTCFRYLRKQEDADESPPRHLSQKSANRVNYLKLLRKRVNWQETK